jgi:HEAT repeat protein
MSENGDEADDADAAAGEEAPADDAPEEAAADAGEETAADEGDAAAGDAPAADDIGATADALEGHLDDVADAVEAAETEADLDDAETHLDAVAEAAEAADLEEGDEDDEEESERERIEGRIEDVRAALDDARGPYAEDVVEAVESAREDVVDGEWTEDGVDALTGAVEAFADAAGEHAGADVDVSAPEAAFEADPSVSGDELASLTAALDEAAAAVGEANLAPDDDADAIAALLAAAEELADAVDAAEEWADLSVRSQLRAHGYYDVLDHRKDFPPEWGAMKVWEQEGRADMVLLALEKFESDFMERHAFEALTRMGPEVATEEMLERAQKRDKQAITVLGKIGPAADEAVDTLVEYVEGGDLPLRKTTLRALGEIGDEAATQAVADQLVAEQSEIRSAAARSLGLLGDTRAVDPLADVLADDDADEVRGAAAWALNRIGTERAREVLADHADDATYLVQAEAERAA